MAVEHGKGRTTRLSRELGAGGRAGGPAAGHGRVSRDVIGAVEEAFHELGMACALLIGILLLGVGMFIRLHVLESPVFAAAQKQTSAPQGMPVMEVLRRHPEM